MNKKDEASPRQRITMEQRWVTAREKCAEGICAPEYGLHVSNCTRRRQKVKVTNLNTGVTSEATIVHSDVRAVKGVLDQHEKQAVRLEPLAEALDVPQEVLDAAEPGSGHYAWSLPGVVVVKDVNDLTQDELDKLAAAKAAGQLLLIPEEPDTQWSRWEKGLFEDRMPVIEHEDELPQACCVSDETAPARPWWKFWGRRG